MMFSDLKFEREEDYPWEEAEMERCIFKDCSISISLWEDGQFEELSGDNVYPSDTVTVTAYYDIEEKIVDYHKAAFDHFIENAKSYEDRLLSYLVNVSNENINMALEYDSKELRAFIDDHSLIGLDGLKKQIFWSGITLYDHGWEGVGFVTFDFECGWDEEHGISILMHKGKIIAESSLGDFTNRGNSMIESAECIQEYTTGYDIKLPYSNL